MSRNPHLYLYLLPLLGLRVAFPQIVSCYEVEELPDSAVPIGDGPHWRDPDLYYADQGSGQIVRYDSSANRTFRCHIEERDRVSFIIPYQQSEDTFAVGLGRAVARVQWDGVSGESCPVVDVIPETLDSSDDDFDCSNNGKCDPRGRLKTDTSNYALDSRNLGPNLHPYVNSSNGVAWNAEGDRVYYVDSASNTITEMDYDLDSGRATNPRVVFQLDSEQFAANALGRAFMDGMTIDDECFLYVAVFGGGAIVKICTKEWVVVERFEMPCLYVTSPTFGGPNLDELYVTSAAELPILSSFPPPCGSTFRLMGVDAKGRPPNEML